MPYQVNTGVDDAGSFLAPGTIVSDVHAGRLLEEHPSSLTRIVHDDDLCMHMVGGCEHDSHEWNAPPAKPAVSAPTITPVSTPSTSSTSAAAAAGGV